jgi:hypothetical protein
VLLDHCFTSATARSENSLFSLFTLYNEIWNYLKGDSSFSFKKILYKKIVRIMLGAKPAVSYRQFTSCIKCMFSMINFTVNSQETFLIGTTVHSSEEVINSIF